MDKSNFGKTSDICHKNLPSSSIYNPSSSGHNLSRPEMLQKFVQRENSQIP